MAALSEFSCWQCECVFELDMRKCTCLTGPCSSNAALHYAGAGQVWQVKGCNTFYCRNCIDDSGWQTKSENKAKEHRPRGRMCSEFFRSVRRKGVGPSPNSLNPPGSVPSPNSNSPGSVPSPRSSRTPSPPAPLQNQDLMDLILQVRDLMDLKLQVQELQVRDQVQTVGESDESDGAKSDEFADVSLDDVDDARVSAAAALQRGGH